VKQYVHRPVATVWSVRSLNDALPETVGEDVSGCAGVAATPRRPEDSSARNRQRVLSRAAVRARSAWALASYVARAGRRFTSLIDEQSQYQYVVAAQPSGSLADFAYPQLLRANGGWKGL